MSYQCVFIRELKRKWWIIAIFVIVLGIAVGVEKTYFGNQIIQSSAFHTEKMVQVGYDKGYSNASPYSLIYCVSFGSSGLKKKPY